MENELECKRAIETRRGRKREIEKKKEKQRRSSCRGDCTDVRGKVLRRALPDLTTPLLPSQLCRDTVWLVYYFLRTISYNGK